MNLVAHAYLSFENKDVLFGNFCCDILDRHHKKRLPEHLQLGLKLHYFIDDFTDSHSSFKVLRDLLFPHYGHYSTVLIDMYYDYFLVANWSLYSNVDYPTYIKNIYSDIDSYNEFFDERSRRVFNAMVKHDWLGRYQTLEGMKRALSDMSKRTPRSKILEHGTDHLVEFHSEIEQEFNVFFPELVEACKQFLVENNKVY